MKREVPERRDLRDVLRRRGLRATGPRVAVYEAFLRLGGHRSVDDVHGALERSETGLTRASVYNVVADLERVGLLKRPVLGSGAARYEIAETVHDHFVCRLCGAVLDVPAAGDRLPPGIDLPAGVLVENAHRVYRGLCADCHRTHAGG